MLNLICLCPYFLFPSFAGTNSSFPRPPSARTERKYRSCSLEKWSNSFLISCLASSQKLLSDCDFIEMGPKATNEFLCISSLLYDEFSRYKFRCSQFRVHCFCRVLDKLWIVKNEFSCICNQETFFDSR